VISEKYISNERNFYRWDNIKYIAKSQYIYIKYLSSYKICYFSTPSSHPMTSDIPYGWMRTSMGYEGVEDF
jgi:hypothetical protein